MLWAPAVQPLIDGERQLPHLTNWNCLPRTKIPPATFYDYFVATAVGRRGSGRANRLGILLAHKRETVAVEIGEQRG